MSFILSQVMGGIALIVYLISYFFKERKNFLIFQFVGDLFYALSYIFDGSLVAGINTFISMTCVLVLFILTDKKKEAKIWLFFIFASLYLVNGVIFFVDFYDLIPIITSILFTMGYFANTMRLTKIFMLIPNIFLVVYGIVRGVYISALLDAIECVVIFSAILEHKIYLKLHKGAHEWEIIKSQLVDLDEKSKIWHYKNYLKREKNNF